MYLLGYPPGIIGDSRHGVRALCLGLLNSIQFTQCATRETTYRGLLFRGARLCLLWSYLLLRPPLGRYGCLGGGGRSRWFAQGYAGGVHPMAARSTGIGSLNGICPARWVG